MGATGLAAMVSGFNAGWHFGFTWFYQGLRPEAVVWVKMGVLPVNPY
jgi:hypothetical protein